MRWEVVIVVTTTSLSSLPTFSPPYLNMVQSSVWYWWFSNTLSGYHSSDKMCYRVVPVQNLTYSIVPPVSTLAAKVACTTSGRNCSCSTWSWSNPRNTGQSVGDVRYLEFPFRRSSINTSTYVATTSFLFRHQRRERRNGGSLKVPGQCLLVLLIKVRSSQVKRFGMNFVFGGQNCK
jgi:hypothetical protein